MASSWGFSWGLSWSSAWGRVRAELSGLGVAVRTPIDEPAYALSQVITRTASTSNIGQSVSLKSSLRAGSSVVPITPIVSTESVFNDWGCVMSPLTGKTAVMSQKIDVGAYCSVERQTGALGGIVASTALKSRIHPHTTIKSTLL